MTKITQTGYPAARPTVRGARAFDLSVPGSSAAPLPAHSISLHALLAAGFVCCAFACMQAAHAGPGPQGREQGRPDQQDEPHGGRPVQVRPPPRGEGPPARAEEAEGRRRAALMQESYAQRAAGIDAARRNSRLTPEERRDLRRQINEAGQDIYSRPPNR